MSGFKQIHFALQRPLDNRSPPFSQRALLSIPKSGNSSQDDPFLVVNTLAVSNSNLTHGPVRSPYASMLRLVLKVLPPCTGAPVEEIFLLVSPLLPRLVLSPPRLSVKGLKQTHPEQSVRTKPSALALKLKHLGHRLLAEAPMSEKDSLC